MITVTAVATCHACGVIAGPGPWADIEKAAERHVRPGHPVGTMARPV